MPVKVLLIQADPLEATAVQDALLLARGPVFQVEWVKSLSTGLDRLTPTVQHQEAADAISAVLVDLMLPDCQGLMTFDQLRGAARGIPILILSAASDEPLAKLAVRQGAQDYLLKAHVDSYHLAKTLRTMIARAAAAQTALVERERAVLTLDCLGDAVVSTDLSGRVRYLNRVAEQLTGWDGKEAQGRPLEEVLRVLDGVTREIVPNPVALAIRQNCIMALPSHCLLVRRDGVETAIEDSTAPIRDRDGRIAGAVMVFRDVTATRAISLRMSHLARHDSLTSLPNRMLLNDRLIEAMGLSRRHHRKLALLFLDIDGFKRVNDSLGHTIGDHLLQSVTQRLLACVRDSDTVSRRGGDEFVILLSELAQAGDAGISAGKILATLRAPHQIREHRLYVTASIGIATYPDDGVEAEVLLKNADTAMYHAKEVGRDNYQFFRPRVQRHALQRQALENALRKAVQRHELTLAYQPQINMQTGSLEGLEALLRWQHPQLGQLAAAHFIRLAEERHCIIPIGRWVLREACAQARSWQDSGSPDVRIAINVSAAELRSTNFVAEVRAALTETGLQPESLELELAEAALMEDSGSILKVLRTLRNDGVQLALDNFGTGYSSLSHLLRYPICTLKIDRSLLGVVSEHSEAAGLVRALIGLARNLHLRVIAAGVESQQQQEFLRQQHCTSGQGFCFGAPASSLDTAAVLQAGRALLLPPGSAEPCSDRQKYM